MKVSSILLALIAGTTLFAAEKIVLNETFDTPEALKKYRAVTYPEGATFEVRDGALIITHRHAYRKGGFIELPIPLIKKGSLEFELTVDCDKDNPGDCVGTTLDLYNISTFWHDSLKDWRYYFPEPVYKKMPFFDIEPVGHQRIKRITRHKTTKYRIDFDAVKDCVEFYADDFSDPASSRFDVSVLGHAFYREGYLRIGSFGYAIPKSYKVKIDNLVLKETSDVQTGTSAAEEILVFNGAAMNFYETDQLFKGKKPRVYLWDNPTYNPGVVNIINYTSLPALATIAKSKLFVFSDVANVPEAIQKAMLEQVAKGANVLIFGGPYTLNNGNFNNSPLGSAAPFIVEGKTFPQQGKFATPQSITACGAFQYVPAGKQPMVYYHQNLSLTEEAEVLLKAGDTPILARKAHGKGYVYVFSGWVLGPEKPESHWNTDLPKKMIDFILAGGK